MKKVLHIILKILKWILMTFILLTTLFLISRAILRKVRLNKSLSNNEISEIREVELGNYKQKILLEGKKKDLPLLVVLHGGPAMPIAFGNGYRGVYSKLTDNYLVIEWDQYGCGNNKNDYKDLTIRDYVNMSEDLIKYLKKEFPNNELYLFGLSWGTILGTYVSNEIPEYVDKYISYGTFTSMNTAYEYLKEQLLKEELSEEDKIKVLELSKNGYSYDNIIELQKISLNYNLSVQGTDKMDSFIYKSMSEILFSPDYTISDVLGILSNNVSEAKIYEEINQIDITNLLENINIPLFIIQGKYDNQTPHYVINNIVEAKENVSYYELSNSGHYPTQSDFDILIDYLVDLKQK